MSTVTELILIVVALAAGWTAIRYLGRFLAWVEKSEIARQKAEAEAERRKAAPAAQPKPAAAPAPDGIPADHLVVIAAAVAACGFRVVHIEDAAAGNAWATEGRWQHQMSHRPH